jgi:hypothetical protein
VRPSEKDQSEVHLFAAAVDGTVRALDMGAVMDARNASLLGPYG